MNPDVMKKMTLLICLGAAKSGTTWLYHQLRRHPDCSLKSIKEIHYFDLIEGRGTSKLLEKNKRALDEVTRKLLSGRGVNSRLEGRMKELQGWLELFRNPEINFESYIEYLADGMLSKHRLVADITPSYALLSRERLHQISVMAQDVRFVYLVRDPVSRLWSNIQMAAHHATKNPDDVESVAARLLERAISGEATSSAQRSDYAAAISKFHDAIPKEKLLVMFYEDLLTNEGFERLCSFLDISSFEASFEERVHSGLGLKMTPDQLHKSRKFLKRQYDFSLRYFDDIPIEWKANLLK